MVHRPRQLLPGRRALTTPPGHVDVATSGSTGTPKRVRLSDRALRASGLATAERLGGHGQWVLALLPHHVAGLQVLARSALAGTSPVALDAGMPFTASAFAAAVGRLSPPAAAPLRLTSLVPTQLHRLLADAEGTAAVASLDAVLLGGAAADPALLGRARAAGVRVVTTYGMSETCGGCVYDGVPLPGVSVLLGEDERVRISGPVLADGYVDLPALTAERFVEEDGARWFVTDDRGRWEETPGGGRRLQVLGRVDDVITTGGHKVEPRDVEQALRGLPGVTDALVVGLPDPEWGQRVGALVVGPDPTALAAEVADRHTLRGRLAATLPPHAVPRVVAVRDGIPLLGPGKPDRAAARAILTTQADLAE